MHECVSRTIESFAYDYEISESVKVKVMHTIFIMSLWLYLLLGAAICIVIYVHYCAVLCILYAYLSISRIFQMGKLKELIVSENRLVSLPQKISSNCPLQQLDLHSNQLTTLPSDLLAHTSK